MTHNDDTYLNRAWAQLHKTIREALDSKLAGIKVIGAEFGPGDGRVALARAGLQSDIELEILKFQQKFEAVIADLPLIEEALSEIAPPEEPVHGRARRRCRPRSVPILMSALPARLDRLRGIREDAAGRGKNGGSENGQEIVRLHQW